MLESNPPRITNWELIETMSSGAAASLPLLDTLIGSVDSLMPQKTHASVTILFACNRRLCSNSAGGRYPSAECKRFRL
jgi:hypothetical protein